MHISLVIGETRYPGKMTDDEINQALGHVRALASMNPPMAISLPLAIFTTELLRELNARGKTEDCERRVAEFSRKELREGLARAKALRALNPRHGIQVCMADLMLAVITELENRSQGKGGRAARIAKGVAENLLIAEDN